jgi:D-lactate dehydrogenase
MGSRAVVHDERQSRSYTTGYRYGLGKAVAVVFPETLVALWRAAQLCARENAIIILQAANTGLTGGSTPNGDYDRPVIVISTERLGGVYPILGGTEAICLAGSTLTQLETAIAPMGRAPHSVIGSSCIGASVIGGICNNSGGALVERGPAFTEHAVYARIREDGELELINRLGVDLGDEPEMMLRKLERGAFLATNRKCPGMYDYARHVRRIDDPTPARYNADPRGLFEASGSAGKVIVFAVRVPTFPQPKHEQTFIIATNSAETLSALRRALLAPEVPLPKLCEYLHRDATMLALSHGNDLCLLLRLLGPGAMPQILKFQKRLAATIGPTTTDRLAHLLGRAAPHPLPRRIRPHFANHEHVLVLTAAEAAIAPIEALLLGAAGAETVVHRATPAEAEAALRLRFAVAGAGVRYRNLAPGGGELATLDIALPRNARDFRLDLPEQLATKVQLRIDYGHFLCHVFHHDFVLEPEVCRETFEGAVKTLVEARGGQMPAEHNFGHLYEAPAHVTAFYRQLDPTNSLNPGIGKTSRCRNWN